MTTRVQSIAIGLPNTDAGNGELIAAMFGRQLRYIHYRKCWMIWKKERWVQDGENHIYSLAIRAARHRRKVSSDIKDRTTSESVGSWALHSEQLSRVKAAVELAKIVSPISDQGEGWDANPYLLGVANGVVDLRSGSRRAAVQEDLISIQIPTPYAPESRCPVFRRFLEDVFIGDVDRIRYVQKAIGYCLTGDVSEQCLFLCHGEGANGKSTLLEIIRYILGGYAHNLPFSAFEIASRSTISDDIAGLQGKRFATASETNENVRLNEGRIKALTGSDPCTARFLYGNLFTFDPSAKFWLAFNHKPQVSDSSHGFWRRIRLIPFDARFDGDKQDKGLLGKLKAEAQGILAWMVEGCLLWQREGLLPPASIHKATSLYREESDPFPRFLDDRFELSAEGIVESQRLHEEYEVWSSANEEKALDARAVATRLKRNGFTDCRVTGQRGRVRAWRGLTLKPDLQTA